MARPALRSVLLTCVLGGLVAATVGVVAAGEDDTETLASTAVVEDVEAIAVSADIPLANDDLEASDVVEFNPASRAAERAALVEGVAVTFTLVVDGEEREVTTSAQNLADALAEAGIDLGWDDEVSADLTAPVEAGSEVRIGRSTTEYVTEQVVTPFETQEVETDELLVGESRVTQEGVDGDARVTSEVTLIDGVEVSRSTVVSTQLTESVPEITEIGTREPAPVVAAGSGSSSSSSVAATGPVDPGSNRALGKELMIAYGFGEDQWACLDNLWMKESRWNHQASNSSSGAYGIPQALPGSKMGSIASDWRTNPATQIQWGLGYISGRYGTPCGAWNSFLAKGWY